MKRNYLYAFLTVFIWGTMAAVAKLLLAGLPNLQTLAVSGAFAFLFHLGLQGKNRRFREWKKYALRDYLIMAGLGFLGLFLYSALYYYGLTQLSSQEACIVNYLWPMMLVLFSCLILKEKFTRLKALAMLCSFAGIVILSGGSADAANGNAAAGIVS